MAHPSLLHLVPTNLWSGRERYAYDICRHFKAEGWNVAVMTRDARVVDDPFAEAGIRICHAPFQGMLDFGSTRRLVRCMESMPAGVPAVVHAHRGWDALRAVIARRWARRPDVKVVLTRHYVGAGRASFLYRWLYRELDAMVCVSQRVADAFLSTWREGRGVARFQRQMPLAPEKLHVLHNSVYDAPRAQTPMPARGPVTAMFHGPLRPDKGLETLIDALRLLKTDGVKLRVRVFGNGNPDYVDRLRRRALQCGVMEMIDWHRHDPAPLPFIAGVHFGVVPSVSAEAFSMPNAEYMAMGRTVVCTATGAQPEYLVNGESAIFIPPANPPALAAALKRLATDAPLRTRMGEAAYKAFSTNLAWRDFAARLTDIYLRPH